MLVFLADFTKPDWFSKMKGIKASFVIHEAYNDPGTEIIFDIALVRLKRPVDRRSALRICEGNYMDSELAVCGLGQTSDTMDILPDVLQEVRMRELSKDTCSLYIRSEGRAGRWDPSVQICANSEERDRNVCNGDSGGALFPLLTNGKAKCVYGVASFLDGCLNDAIFTRASAYSDWILTKIEQGF